MTRNIYLLVLSILIFSNLLYGASDDYIEKKIQKIISKMTLEEKAGQMTQITIETISETIDGKVVLDKAKLQNAIVEHQIGSIINCGGQSQSIENWHKIITEIQDVATKKTHLGIPILYGIDSIHGAGYINEATIFPHNIALAATGNKNIVRRVAKITAFETRAAGIPWNFSPALDVAREPLWPRFFETFGEDPYMVSVFGCEVIRGLQGDTKNPTMVAACMKHFLGYSTPKSGLDRTPAWIPERMLRQIFLLPFKHAVDAGAMTIMINSSEINGIPVHSSTYYLNKILRDELDFKGLVVSDWSDIKNLYIRERVAESQQEAVKLAVLAGIDMSMVPYDYSFRDYLVDLVNKGEIPESRINEAVQNILRVKFQLGLFDSPYPTNVSENKYRNPKNIETNYLAASEAITLLKNQNGILPLLKDKKVLITGPAANSLSCLNGGWTFTWQGDNESLYPQEKDTILEAIKKIVGGEKTYYVKGVSFSEEEDIQKAVELAKSADFIISCIGEPAYCEASGNIYDLTISLPQRNLIKALSKTGKPIVLVLVQGRPRIISEIEPFVDGVVMAYLPGLEGGTVIADILYGEVNPSGKLPFTYPRYPNGYTLYDHKKSEEYGYVKFQPQWQFGHGLSYTTFEYSNLLLDKKSLSMQETLSVCIDVKNTGNIVGQEIVQLFISDEIASVTPAVRQLKRFTKIKLKPNESKTVEFKLNNSDFAFVGRENKWIVEPGKFSICIGNLSKSFILR